MVTRSMRLVAAAKAILMVSFLALALATIVGCCIQGKGEPFPFDKNLLLWGILVMSVCMVIITYKDFLYSEEQERREQSQRDAHYFRPGPDGTEYTGLTNDTLHHGR
jgi:TctA family transporter